MTMPTHQWHLEVTRTARKHLDELPLQDRMAVFRSLVEVLVAENPTSLPDVKKLVEKKFEGQWRKRQGNYRILFSIESKEIVHEKFTYKGTITVNSVVHRSKAYGS
jgi:mRNA-degrading endonuclease RelE of RelBE toxin-antitoxin system